MSAEPGSLDDLRRSAPKPEGFRVALTSPRSVVACLLAGVDPNTLVPREIPPSALPHPDRAYENRERENRERRRRALNDVRLRQLLARRSSLSDADVARHRRVLCGADARDAAAAARRIERATKWPRRTRRRWRRCDRRNAPRRWPTVLDPPPLKIATTAETEGARGWPNDAREEEGEKRTKTTPRREAPRTETTPRREAPRTETTPRREAPRTNDTETRGAENGNDTETRVASRDVRRPRDVSAASRDVFAASRDAPPPRATSPLPRATSSPPHDSLGRAAAGADAAELERVARASRSSAERRVVSRAFLAETRAAREKANASIAESSARVDAAEAAVLSALDDVPSATPRKKGSGSADWVRTPVASPRRAGAFAVFSPGSPFAPSPRGTRPSPRPRPASASPSARDRAAAKAHRETMRASLRAVESAERDAFETAANALVESKIAAARGKRAAAERIDAQNASRRNASRGGGGASSRARAQRRDRPRLPRAAEARPPPPTFDGPSSTRRSWTRSNVARRLRRTRRPARRWRGTRAAEEANDARRRDEISGRAAAAAKTEAKFAAASDAARRAAENAERNRARNARAISGKEATRAAKLEERLRETEMKAAAARERRNAATRRLTFAAPMALGGAGGVFDGTLPETPEFQRHRAGIEGPGCVPVELVVSPGRY